MPYSVVSDHPECDGFAVIKTSDGKLIGCHRTEKQAQSQLAAINASEYDERSLPENYRPASSKDVPDGRNCANCDHYDDGYCSLWKANVKGSYYCNKWSPREARADREKRVDRALEILKNLLKP